MLRIKEWDKSSLDNKQDIIRLIKNYKKESKGILFFDTETTGLHIIKDKPFLLQLGYIDPTEKKGWVYVVEGEELIINTAKTMLALAKKFNVAVAGHNIKYDLHMLQNLGIETSDDINYLDTMTYIRGAHDALTVANGGPPLGLKDYCKRYIDRKAADHERLLLQQRTSIAKEYNVELKNKLYKIDKYWTLKRVDDFFKDVLNSVDTLPNNVRPAYIEWYTNLPDVIRRNMTTGRVESNNIPYTMLDRDVLTEYAMFDIIYTAEVYLQCRDAIIARDNEMFLERENKMIPALVRMERCGFEMDKDYIRQATVDMADYLKTQRKKLYELVGREISVGQHAVIKNILTGTYGLSVPGTGKEDLNRIYDELKHSRPEEDVTKFIGLVQELRTLEKWYSTYLLRFVREMETSDRVYTQINQVGTVSGRVTSDFQQFPKFGIKDCYGEDLFNPRAMIKTTPGFKGIAYLDYSQIELRVQALYTILVGHPDLNLCRAYMPYKCYAVDSDPIGCGLYNNNMIPFDYNNPEHIKHAYDWHWYHEEDDAPWSPVDVHAATTHVAFPDIPVDSDEFKKLRGKVGKRVNFAKNYGAQFNRIKQMFPDFDDDTIHKIDDAYYLAFPGVKKYHEYCYNIVKLQASVTNLFGVKYYGLSGHKLINCLVQGSSAYFLKDRIYEVDKYIKENNLKSRLQMQIHDELSYEIFPGEEHHVAQFQRIMQEWEGCIVPIVADLEFTTTTWAAKEEVDSLA